MKKKEQKARQFVRVVLVVGFLGVFGLGAVWLRHLGTFGVQKIEVADKTAVCDYTNAQATSDYTFDINSIPVVNLQIDVAKDAIVEEYIEGL
ncbi:MAG: hypothetical protein LBQ02_00855, partial [Candidatus Nomurabacteria bacterium]|nr:hypothetical protein [Candidatus Nomurabacteria bacterium]